jgi:hypothetical protein
MPRNDQTGPLGDGPKTGQGAGPCTVDSQADDGSHMSGPGYGNGFGPSRGFRCGMGRGRRARRGGFFGQPNPQDERSLLENQRETLRSRLTRVDERLGELSAQESQES